MQTGKTVMLTTNALKGRLDKEKERGRRAAIAEVESKARALGYESAAEMYAALEKLKAGAVTPSAEPVKKETKPMNEGGKNNGQRDSRADKEIERLRKESDERERQRRHAEKQAKSARKREEEARIESQLARAAALAGIRNDDDIEYAIHLLRSEVKRDPSKFNGAETFDERKWFDTLRETKPHLFGDAPKPASTGVNMGTQPLPPKPGEVTTQTAQNGQFNARTATRDELNKEMTRRGLRFNP